MDDGLSATAVPHHTLKPPPLLAHVQELSALQVVVQGVDATGLLVCWDYLAFPLMLITDSVRPARMQLTQQQQRGQLHTQGAEEASEEPSEVAVPAAQSDRVAEAALGRDGLFSLSVSCLMHGSCAFKLIRLKECHLQAMYHVFRSHSPLRSTSPDILSSAHAFSAFVCLAFPLIHTVKPFMPPAMRKTRVCLTT